MEAAGLTAGSHVVKAAGLEAAPEADGSRKMTEEAGSCTTGARAAPEAGHSSREQAVVALEVVNTPVEAAGGSLVPGSSRSPEDSCKPAKNGGQEVLSSAAVRPAEG